MRGINSLIKKFKKLLPLRENLFSKYMSMLTKKINLLSDDLKNIEIKTENLHKLVTQQNDEKIVYWNNIFEKRYVQRNWGNVSEQQDFEQRFMKLVSGMDGESVQKLSRIISRQNKYLNSNEVKLNLFSQEEQDAIRNINEKFKTEIYKVSESVYSYKNYFLPINHFDASVFWYKHGIYELNDANKVKGKAIIDVGGFIGDSVLVLSELQPNHIYSFEANPKNAELMNKTILLNNCCNVTVESVALSNTQGEIILHAAGDATSAVLAPGSKYEGDIVVPVTTLDSYVLEHNIEVGLIKVDIEGGEPMFLAGAYRTICEQRPILLISIYHNSNDFFDIKPMIESWGLGYKFKIHRPVTGNATSDTLLLAEIN